MAIDLAPPAPGTVVKADTRDPVSHSAKKPETPTREEFTPATTDIDAVYDTMIRCLSREIQALDRQSAAGGLRTAQYDALGKLSAAITAAYRARPGKPVDPLEQRANETDEEYRARLEKMR